MTRRLLAAVLAGAAGLAAVEDGVPWPGGVAPDALAVEATLDVAETRWEQERFLEFQSAIENETEVAVANVLQHEIDEGIFDEETMSLYGRRLFQLHWRPEMGLGRSGDDGRLRVVHTGDAPGLDAHACEGCHSQGGPDGGGAFTQTAHVLGDGDRASSAALRNPPSLLGAGLVQALAVEMSAELSTRRAEALAEARRTGQRVELDLLAKGVAFGTLRALPDGSVDTSGVEGVSADLVVRPFGWKGDVARLRRFVEEASRTHFGVIAHAEAQRAREAGPVSRLGGGADWEDPDGDGVRRELEDGIVTSGAVYLAMLETPVILPPADPALAARWASGDRLFDAVGCAGCHVRALVLGDRIWRERPDGAGSPGFELNLLVDGDPPRGTDQVALFSDLKRHDLGPELADAVDHPDGIPHAVFLTRPLWGLAETAPYLHDGRASTIPSAILAHGGEASASRDAFAALSADEQADLHVFLLSLTRSPKVRVAR